MRNPNGFGSIKKLSGKRRRPFAVVVTTGWTMENGKAKQIQKCIGYYETRPEAMIALADYNKNPFDIDKRNTTFEQVYNILFEKEFSQMKPSAMSSYTSAYAKCDSIKNIRMIEMRKAHMQDILDSHSDKSTATLNNFLKLFHAIYKFSMENDICEKDYSQFLTIKSEAEKKDKIPFSREEIQMLWNNLDWQPKTRSKKFTKMYLVDAALIHIYTGVRPAELLDIKKTDVNIEERYIDLRGTKTKAAKRLVPIHKKIIPLIEARMNADSQSEFLFPMADGKRIKDKDYRELFFSRLCSDLIGTSHTPHECRHTFATFANASAMNKVLLKKIIGHSTGDLTEDTYTHAFIEDLVKEIDKLEL